MYNYDDVNRWSEMMRTTLTIDEQVLKDVFALTGEKNLSKAVHKALAEYIRRRRLEELRAMAGKVDLVNNLKELEELEIREIGRTQW